MTKPAKQPNLATDSNRYNLNDVKSAMMETSIVEKTQKVNALYRASQSKQFDICGEKVVSIPNPPLPAQVKLSTQQNMVRRGLGTLTGRQSMIHAIAHIEYNAINLALDAVYRFRDMPYDYYQDWLKVAHEEAYHFNLISDRLRELGCKYGDFPGHAGLWAMCVDTEHDVLIRMALVPRVMEARGLDVTPKIQIKLASIGDKQSVDMLDIIYQDELGHVAIGSHWFKYCCKLQQRDPTSTFRQLLKQYLKNGLNTDFNYPARLQAGFDHHELTLLEQNFS